MNYADMYKMKELVARLNRYRDEYYNKNAPTVSDAVYDRLFDELVELEESVGICMANSPTQTVGYPAVSALEKVSHDVPLLSLEKTKRIEDLLAFKGNRRVNLSLKLDGLTTELIYEDGSLQRVATRGDGEVGENITHNACAVSGIPDIIPYPKRLVVVGETFIRNSDFEKLQSELQKNTAELYKNGRNLAAGSVRAYDSAVCASRRVSFLPFSVLEGFEEYPEWSDSKYARLLKLRELGFDMVRTIQLTNETEDSLEQYINAMRQKAADDDLPIDGLVMSYDEIAFSKSCGRTGHHYKDGIAFKFEDELYESVLRSIEWTPSRSGEITPVAIFDTVEIDGCDVSRASLHNLSFMEELELMPGCRVLVSKRNQIIPHIEENLDRGGFDLDALIPHRCPCCGAPTRINVAGAGGTKTLFCDNLNCDMRHLRRFIHFAGKKAMDIEGLSGATLERFIAHGWLHTFMDLYRLNEHEAEIVRMDGFGEKSWRRLWEAIENSRNTTFERYLISMDIPMIGNSASKELGRRFDGDLKAFENAVDSGYDFTQLPDFGETLHQNIHRWFQDEENRHLWEELQKMMNIEKKTSALNTTTDTPFAGLTIVVTGKVEPYTRSGINAKIESLGAHAGSSVSKNTDYLICGENAGSKLDKARTLGIPVLSPAEFFRMAGEN